MKAVRKGFTLVELLIVLAVLGSLSAMMTGASSDAIDTSTASAILGNLRTLKAAAFEMYMEKPEVASTATIKDDTSITIGTEAKAVKEILGEYVGKKTIGTKYHIIGSSSAWYVYYELGADENTNVRAKLKAKAEDAGLWGTTSEPAVTTGAGTTEDPTVTHDDCGFENYYDATNFANEEAGSKVYIALRVR